MSERVGTRWSKTERFYGEAALELLSPKERYQLARLALELSYVDQMLLAGSRVPGCPLERARRGIDDLLRRLFLTWLHKQHVRDGSEGLPNAFVPPSIIDDLERRRCRTCGYQEIEPFADGNDHWVFWNQCASCWHASAEASGS